MLSNVCFIRLILTSLFFDVEDVVDVDADFYSITPEPDLHDYEESVSEVESLVAGSREAETNSQRSNEAETVAIESTGADLHFGNLCNDEDSKSTFLNEDSDSFQDMSIETLNCDVKESEERDTEMDIGEIQMQYKVEEIEDSESDTREKEELQLVKVVLDLEEKVEENLKEHLEQNMEKKLENGPEKSEKEKVKDNVDMNVEEVVEEKIIVDLYDKKPESENVEELDVDINKVNSRQNSEESIIDVVGLGETDVELVSEESTIEMYEERKQNIENKQSVIVREEKQFEFCEDEKVVMEVMEVEKKDVEIEEVEFVVEIEKKEVEIEENNEEEKIKDETEMQVAEEAETVVEETDLSVELDNNESIEEKILNEMKSKYDEVDKTEGHRESSTNRCQQDPNKELFEILEFTETHSKIKDNAVDEVESENSNDCNLTLSNNSECLSQVDHESIGNNKEL